MRRERAGSFVLTAMVVVSVLVGSAAGGINTSNPIGDLSLVIQSDDEAFLINTGTQPVQTDGYTFLSASAALSPGGWIPLCEEPWPLPLQILPLLPPDPYHGWAVMSRTTSNLSEVSMLTTVAVFEPGVAIPIGRPAPGGTQADITFTYVDPASGGWWEGRVVPEPASATLIALGALGLARARRRRR